MAAGILPAPGTENGPCEERCSHSDCATSRAMAKVVCHYCGEPIGYDRGFYSVGTIGVTDHTKLVHASCEIEAVEQPRA